MISIQEALHQLNQGKLAPVYLFSGTEFYFIEQFKLACEKLYSSDDTGEITTYDLREVAIQDVIADAETFPFFTEKKLIFVENPFFLTNIQEKNNVEHDVTQLEKYIENPAPFTHFIVIAPYEKLDGRKKITKTIRNQSVEVDCRSIKGAELQKWVQSMIEPMEVTITDAARDILEAEFGSNLYMLQKEIEKLAQYVGKGETINEAVLHEAMSSSLEQSSLELVDAVLHKKLKEAIRIYKQLEKMREDPIGLIALLAYQFRIIYQVKLFRAKGYSMQQIQNEINAHPYVIKLAYERGRKYSEAYLSKIIDELAKTDTLIKQGRMNKEIAFEMLLYEIVTS